MIEAQDALVAERIDGGDDDVLVGGEDRQDVGRRLLVPVDLAAVERRRGGRGVRDIEPLDAVDLGGFAARGKARRLPPRQVFGVFDEHRLAAGDPFRPDEFERPGADCFRDLLVRIGLGEPLRHHERHVARQLAEGGEQQRERRFEFDRKRLVVDRLDRADRLQQFLPERVALAPALDRGDTVGRAHRPPIMPFEAVAQCKGVAELVGALRPAVDHLRLRLEILVEREQRVEDEVAEIACDVGRRPDRIDAAQVGLRDEAQGLRRRLRPGRQRRRAQHEEPGNRRPLQHPAKQHMIATPVRLFAARQAYSTPPRGNTAKAGPRRGEPLSFAASLGAGSAGVLQAPARPRPRLT